MNPLFPQEAFLPSRILFKKDALLELAKETAEFGTHGIIVYGASLNKSGRLDTVKEIFQKEKLCPEFFCRNQGEPTLDEISIVIKKGHASKAQWMVGIGGGSVLDLAKAAAGLFHAREKPVFYQEGGRLTEKGIPFIAVPTTAGSGSEATLNAVIINPEKKVKLSIRDKSFLAQKVMLDPHLLQGLPVSVMRDSGMDAWVQAYESFISKHSTWFSESFALKAIQLISHHLIPALTTGREENLSALLLGSFFSGIAFSHSRLGVIHGIAHPLGVLYNIPHGLICAACFAPSIKMNLPVIQQKYEILSQTVGMDFLQKITLICRELEIVSPFKKKPLLEKEKIIEETLRSGSTAANPKFVNREDVESLLRELF